MGDGTYNGWTNYPTWATTLWLGNDEGIAQEVERVAHRWEEETRDGGTVSQLADTLADLAEELLPAASAGLAADLLGYAFGEIDFQQIAHHAAVDVLDAGTDDADTELDRRRRLYLDHTLAQFDAQATR